MVKKIIFLSLFVAQLIIAQAQKIDLNIQGKGNEVKLLWFCAEWDAKIDGLVLQRKSGSGTWQQLGSLIRPALYGEELSTRTNDPILAKKLEVMRDSLIAVGRWKKSDYETMKREVLLKTDILKFVVMMASFNYQEALAMGFAYQDTKIPASTEVYTYAIFAQINGVVQKEPLASANWKYGDDVKLVEFEQSCIKKKLSRTKGFEISWLLELNKVRNEGLRDYVVYKIDTLNNKKLITPEALTLNMSSDPVSLIVKQADYEYKEKATFQVILRDYFDTPRIKFEVKITPEDFPIFPRPILSVSHTKESSKEVLAKWDFPDKFDKYITQIELKKGYSPDDMESIFVFNNMDSYTDHEFSKNGAYYYKLKITTNTGDILFSDIKSVVKYFPLVPPKPNGLIGKYENQNITLKWYKNPYDNITKEYRVYRLLPNEQKKGALMTQLALGQLVGDSVQFLGGTTYGEIYKYAIRAVSEDYSLSEYSDTIEVLLPTQTLPPIQIFPFKKDKNRVTLEWKYPDYIKDLVGFRLYQNDKILLDEMSLDASKRSWQLYDLELKKYTYSIQAVTTSGVLSNISDVRQFVIKEKY